MILPTRFQYRATKCISTYKLSRPNYKLTAEITEILLNDGPFTQEKIMSHWFNDKMFRQFKLSTSKIDPLPIPTQIISNGKFNPQPQTEEQKLVEKKILAGIDRAIEELRPDSWKGCQYSEQIPGKKRLRRTGINICIFCHQSSTPCSWNYRYSGQWLRQ